MTKKFQTGLSIAAVAGLFFLMGGEVKAQTSTNVPCTSAIDCSTACGIIDPVTGIGTTPGFCVIESPDSNLCNCCVGSTVKKATRHNK